MDQYSLIYIVIFGLFIVWILYKIIKVNPNVIHRTKFLSTSGVLFITAGIFSLISLFVNHSYMDFFRTFIMVIAIVLFLFLKEGLGEEGFYSGGSYTLYNDVVSYDYYVEKKKFIVHLKLRDPKGKDVNEQYNAKLEFDLKNKDIIEKFLKNKLNKKYKRIKK